MLSPAAERALPPLVAFLEETLQALAHLHATAARLRPTDGCAASGFPAFSLVELDRLRILTRQGGAGVTRRLKELVGDRKPAGHLAELWREGVARPPDTDLAAAELSAAEARSRSLLSAYRAACRALGASIRESRRSADGATTVMLSGLLQRLEKQLWLLDSSPARGRIGLPTINLFLSC
jgi:hypothetical protein